MSTKEKSAMNNREADAQNFEDHERLLGNWRSEAFLDGDHWNFRDVEPQHSPNKALPGGPQTS